MSSYSHTTKQEFDEFKEAYEKKAILSEISLQESKAKPENGEYLKLSKNLSTQISYIPNKDDDISLPDKSRTFSLLEEDKVALKQLYRSHLTTTKDVEGSPKYLCNLCGKEFLKRWHGYNHVDSKHLPNVQHSCDICLLIFKRHQQLTRHIKSKHDGKRPNKSISFYCPECRKGFTTKQNFISHMKSHQGLLDYKCTDCSAAYTQPTPLKYHRLQKHTQEHRFWCFLCGKGFMLNSFLNKHKDVHTAPSLQCKYCEKKFMRNQHLVKHERSHLGIKQFQCKICPKKYIHSENLRCHMKKHINYQAQTIQKSSRQCEVKLPRLRIPEIWFKVKVKLPIVNIPEI